MSHHQNARSFENVVKFKYLGTTVKNQNCIRWGGVSATILFRILRLSSRPWELLTEIQEAIIFLVVLDGCETWSLTLREEHRLRVSENRVLRGVFGPKREEVTGGWRRLHNEELHNLYSSPNIITVIKSRRML
jgi:hypothetical protein